jgi:hypothetical protein
MADVFARALASLGGGLMQGQDQARQMEQTAAANARQKAIDTQTQANADRQFRETQSNDSLKRAIDMVNAGLTPAPTATPPAVLADPAASEGGLVDAPQNAAPNAPAAPQGPMIPVMNQQGGTDQLVAGEPMALRKIRETADAAQSRQQAVDAQKAKEAADAATLKNQRLYGGLKAEFPHHPLAKAPFDPNTDYASAIADQRDLRKIGAAQPHMVAVQDLNDPTKGVLVPASEAAGRAPWKGAVAGNAQNAPQMAAAKANLESAMKVIDDYDLKRKNGTANYTVNEATKGAIGSAPEATTAKPGMLGKLDSYFDNAANADLNKNNSDLAAYLTAKKFVAEAILNTHKRPNQTQYEIEQELSAPGVNASPFQLDLAKARRDKMYQEVFGGASGASPASGGKIDIDALMKKHGLTP